MNNITHHPIQPLQKDEYGTLRFKGNAIVRYMLDNGGLNLNHLMSIDFSNEDRQQFAQLISYSLSGYSDLFYVDDAAYAAASIKAEENVSDTEARLRYYEELVSGLKEKLKEPMAALFEKHPDDFDRY